MIANYLTIDSNVQQKQGQIERGNQAAVRRLIQVIYVPSPKSVEASSKNRPYALMSHLHNNDAMLGVKTCRAVRTCCAGRGWQSASAPQSVRGPGQPAQPGGMACRGWPAGCMLGDSPRGSASFDPQHMWAPFCDVICIWSITT